VCREGEGRGWVKRRRKGESDAKEGIREGKGRGKKGAAWGYSPHQS